MMAAAGQWYEGSNDIIASLALPAVCVIAARGASAWWSHHHDLRTPITTHTSWHDRTRRPSSLDIKFIK